MRKTKFQIGNYYHIYNRGVDKRRVFMDEKAYYNASFPEGKNI